MLFCANGLSLLKFEQRIFNGICFSEIYRKIDRFWGNEGLLLGFGSVKNLNEYWEGTPVRLSAYRLLLFTIPDQSLVLPVLIQQRCKWYFHIEPIFQIGIELVLRNSQNFCQIDATRQYTPQKLTFPKCLLDFLLFSSRKAIHLIPLSIIALCQNKFPSEILPFFSNPKHHQIQQWNRFFPFFISQKKNLKAARNDN